MFMCIHMHMYMYMYRLAYTTPWRCGEVWGGGQPVGVYMHMSMCMYMCICTCMGSRQPVGGRG